MRKPLSSSSSYLIQNHQFAQLTLSFFGSVHNFTKQFALCKEVFAFFHDCNCFVTPPTAQTQEIFTGKTGFAQAARSGPVLLRRRSAYYLNLCIVILLYSLCDKGRAQRRKTDGVTPAAFQIKTAGFSGRTAYFPKYAAICSILLSCFTWKGQRLSQWPHLTQSEAAFSRVL